MANSNKRADVVLYKGLYNVLTDVRTIAGGDQRCCCAAASSPGHGAAWGAVQKNAAWLAQARSQGEIFLALCHEAGGRTGRDCDISLTSSAPSLPRRKAPPGDARGPRGPPGGLAAAGATPPPPRPVINFTTNLRSPHHAGCEESTFTKIHVPLIATVRATPGT